MVTHPSGAGHAGAELEPESGATHARCVPSLSCACATTRSSVPAPMVPTNLDSSASFSRSASLRVVMHVRVVSGGAAGLLP